MENLQTIVFYFPFYVLEIKILIRNFHKLFSAQKVEALYLNLQSECLYTIGTDWSDSSSIKNLYEFHNLRAFQMKSF
jgi:hypothetical protein